MKSFQMRFSTLVHSLLTAGLVLILLVGFQSCEEKGDTEQPFVSIQQPYENQPFNTIDTFFVTISASDNERLVSLDIELLDQNFNFLGIKSSHALSGSQVTYTAQFFLDAPHLESGFYYIAARVSDGTNKSSAFRKVVLNAIPRVLERVMVTTVAFNNVRVLSRPAGGGSWTEHLNRQVDFAGAGLNYKQNIFALAGGELGDAYFYETGEWGVVNHLPGPGFPSLPFFTNLTFDDKIDEFMLLLTEPRMRVYDKFAAGLNGFPLQAEHRPLSAYATGNFYFVVEKAITTPQHSLGIYARPGLLMAFLALSGPLKGIYSKSANEVFLWEDGVNGARLRILNTQTYLISTVFERTGEPLRAVDQLGNGSFVFSTSAGMYRYNYSNGGTVVISGSVTPHMLKYEPLSGTIYTATGSFLQRYSITGQFLGAEAFSQQVGWFGFDYNR